MRYLLPLLLLGCGRDPEGSDGCPDFQACADGVCLAGECMALAACEGECAPGHEGPVVDSLLASCHDQDGVIDCPGEAGSDACAETPLCGQDAQYGWDATHDRSERFVLTDGDGEAVVVDQVSGLSWQGCVMGQAAGCQGQAVRGPWEAARQYCEDSTWGGYDDWVLPSSYQLLSIVDYSTTSPAIDLEAFQDAPSLFDQDSNEWWIECVWTGDDYAGDPDVAWAGMVNSGDMLVGSGVPYHLHDKEATDWEGCYARCLRQRPAAERVRHIRLGGEEPVVADVPTQAMWQGCSAGQHGDDCAGEAEQLSWADALSYCEGLRWGGYDDWRLPDIMELGGLPDRTRQSPAIDSSIYPNTPSWSVSAANERVGQYWSSTSRWYQGFALYVSFNDGGSHFYVQEEGRHVRCVR